MSERNSNAPYDGAAMLAAFRKTRGPSEADADALWDRLDLETAEDDIALVPAPAAVPPWRWVAVVAAAIAAAFVLGWWLRGAPVRTVARDDRRDMASRQAIGGTDGLAAARDTRPRGVATTASHAPEPTLPESEPEPAGAVSIPPAPTAPAPPPVRRRADVDNATGRKAPPEPPAVSPPPPSKPAANTLAEEAALLSRARRAFASGNDRRTIALIDQYRETYARGQLAEEADAVGTMARCRAQPQRSTTLAAAFAERHPRSMHLPGIERACSEGPAVVPFAPQ